MDRDAFISRIASAVMMTDLPAPAEVPERLPDLDPVDNLALFHERAVETDAVVHGPVSQHGVPRAVAGIAAGHDAGSFMAWDELPAAGVAAALSTAGLERIESTLPESDRKIHQQGYRDVALGITGADAALAESGSIVLSHGQGRSRMVSLIPDVHIALVEVRSIERTLAHWAHRNPGAAMDTTNLVLVTGPSRTGDIGQHLTLGVHGPRHLHLVLVQ